MFPQRGQDKFTDSFRYSSVTVGGKPFQSLRTLNMHGRHTENELKEKT